MVGISFLGHKSVHTSDVCGLEVTRDGSEVPGRSATGSTALGLIGPTPARSPAGRHGDWCCRCRSSVCSSSWPLPAAAAACSSVNKNQQDAN